MIYQWRFRGSAGIKGDRTDLGLMHMERGTLTQTRVSPKIAL